MLFVTAASIVLGVLCVGVAPASAASALDVVRDKQTQLFDALKAKPPNQKKVQALFDEMLDYQALAEGVLGPEWGNRSDAEKADFTNVLKQLVQKAYERNLKKTLGYDIKYVGEEPKEGATFVKTKAASKTNAREEPIEIDFKMLERSGAWKVQDIVTDGTSLVGNFRQQFTKIIKKDGFSALMKKMRDKLAKNED